MKVKVNTIWSQIETDILYDEIRGEYEAYHLEQSEDSDIFTVQEGWSFKDFVRAYKNDLTELFPEMELVEDFVEESDDRIMLLFKDYERGSSVCETFEIV